MSRSIDSTITQQLSGNELHPFHLVDFTVGSTTYRYTDFQIPLYVDTIPTSGTFNSWSWSFGGTHHSIDSIVDDVEVTLLNLNNIFTTLFIESTVQGAELNLWSGVVDTDGNIIGTPYRIFTGEIDEWNLSEDEITITVVSELYQWSQSTIKRHSPSCRWRKFKGDYCRYAGAATWCDRSYNRCEALDNVANFGGFRWLAKLEDAEIWWGRERLKK